MNASPIPPLHLYSVPSGPQPAPTAPPARERPRTAWTADQLMATEFPEPKWAVPGILAEGVSLLAGPPKVGKSWLSLGLGLSVAAGGHAFDSVPVDGGPVLYLALEDTPRRLKTRMGKLLGGQKAPAGLTLVTECPPFPQGGSEAIAQWLERNPDARMVVIDVFAKMRGQAPQGVSAYDADYVSVGYAKRLADHYGIAVVLVHHVRKMASEDFLTEVSGTNGIAGAADATLVLKRARGQADGILHVTGRDVNEAEYALQFQEASGAWHLLDGPASDHTIGDTRAAILRHVRANPGAKPKDIADALPQVDTDTVRRTCSRMATDGQLTKDGSGRYYPDTDTRTQTTQQVSQLSDCPVTPSDQHKQPGQLEAELSGLSDRSACAGQQGGI
ncbi:AAA family ATPase [Streptomyces sp. NBC_00121]|uniref:AAA family ATPase n=1 Tax=unclassified Streptomyces TaxID=2593676 RepID=UPI002DD9F346|nr:AAA family ATPase [Streptomyces sp. NBC_01760]WSC71689.1 AAA family ATPase [Streptomyces sp. NBC_01760]WTE62169.1 AAA family ATPase [Streptomyces sp. NBC_01617]